VGSSGDTIRVYDSQMRGERQIGRLFLENTTV